MAGDDPKPFFSKDNHDDDSPYEPFDDEFDLFSLMSDLNPTLMDFVFNTTVETPLPLPPPPLPLSLPLPLPPPPPPSPPPLSLPPIPDDTNMEVNESQIILQQPSNEIPDDNDQHSPFNWAMVEQINADLDGDINFDLLLNDRDVIDLLNEIDMGDDSRDGIVSGRGDTRLEVITNPVFGGNFETGGPSTTPAPVVTPVISDGIFVCSCCRRLRTITHNNGGEVMRLDLHGGDDYFCHGIFEIQRFFEGFTERQHQTFHFKGLSAEDVQRFVEAYLAQRQATCLELLEDSCPSLFQAMNNQLFMPALPPIPMSLTRSDEALNVPPVPLYISLSEPPKVPKQKQRRQTALAAQRARTRLLTLKDLAPFFGIPIEEAARRLSICPTVAKKISRRGGLSRWPHRKIRSMNRRISQLQSELRYARDPVVIANTQQEIERIQKGISDFCAKILKKMPPPP